MTAYQLKGKCLKPGALARSILEAELSSEIVDELCYTNDFMWQIGSVDTELLSTCVGAHVTNAWSACDREFLVRKNIVFQSRLSYIFFLTDM